MGKVLQFTVGLKLKRHPDLVVAGRYRPNCSFPDVARLPSKNVIHKAKAITLVRPKTGLRVTKGQLEVGMAGVARRKRDDLHLANFKASEAELVMGEAPFTELKTVTTI